MELVNQRQLAQSSINFYEISLPLHCTKIFVIIFKCISMYSLYLSVLRRKLPHLCDGYFKTQQKQFRLQHSRYTVFTFSCCMAETAMKFDLQWTPMALKNYMFSNYSSVGILTQLLCIYLHKMLTKRNRALLPICVSLYILAQDTTGQPNSVILGIEMMLTLRQ